MFTITRHYKIIFFLILSVISFSLEGQTEDRTLQYDGEEREYVLHVPAIYDGMDEVPLVIALHGLTNSGNILFETSRFDLVADTANFIVAFPTALTNGANLTAWENGLIVGSGADDLGFLNSLMDTISTEYSIDAQRIYFTGFSMGGFMSNRIACEFSDKVAAIASHSGTIADPILNDCNPERPFPMMHIHGTSDLVVGYDGNWLAGFESTDTLMRFWRDHNNCSNTYSITELEDIADDNRTVDKVVFGPCDDNIELWLYTVNNHGHSWLQEENDISSSKEIWDFFSKYTLDRPVISSTTEEINPIPIKLYPNPTSKDINLQVPSSLQNEIISIHNSLGDLVYSQKYTNRPIDTKNLSPGIYVLRIKGYSYRFVKI